MKKILPPVSKELLKSELTRNRFVRRTNKGGKEIYIITHHNAPNVMLEIGRLREETFRAASGGTGKEVDIDIFDTSDIPFKQLIVWDPMEEEITGGYRYLMGKEMPSHAGEMPRTPTAKLFQFSNDFIQHYWANTIELGRSFVQPSYQPNLNLRKGMYSLDNLWDGLGALIILNPDMKYFFGKFTMYPDFNARARDMIMVFLNKYFPDNDRLVFPREEHELFYKASDVSDIESLFSGADYAENVKILNKEVRSLGENIPPLVNAYMNLSATMKTFGTAINSSFGDVEETGIMITMADMYEGKTKRHIESYSRNTAPLDS